MSHSLAPTTPQRRAQGQDQDNSNQGQPPFLWAHITEHLGLDLSIHRANRESCLFSTFTSCPAHTTIITLTLSFTTQNTAPLPTHTHNHNPHLPSNSSKMSTSS
jgi:hypothetical protein